MIYKSQKYLTSLTRTGSNPWKTKMQLNFAIPYNKKQTKEPAETPRFTSSRVPVGALRVQRGGLWRQVLCKALPVDEGPRNQNQARLK